MTDSLKPMSESIPNEVLECLNGWPEGSDAHIAEQHLIYTLNQLCQQHGYGRVPQLAAAIEEIWRSPEKGLEKWRVFHAQRMEDWQKTIKAFADKKARAKKVKKEEPPPPPDPTHGTMFIGLKMDEKSTETIHQWLLECAKPIFNSQGLELYRPVPKPFLYLPLVYSGSPRVPVEELKGYVIGKNLKIKVELTKARVKRLGETGNVSLVFEDEWIRERYQFWVEKQSRFREKSFKPRIPMSHHCNNLDANRWLKLLPIREITLIEEFYTEFDRKTFFRELKKAY